MKLVLYGARYDGMVTFDLFDAETGERVPFDDCLVDWDAIETEMSKTEQIQMIQDAIQRLVPYRNIEPIRQQIRELFLRQFDLLGI